LRCKNSLTISRGSASDEAFFNSTVIYASDARDDSSPRSMVAGDIEALHAMNETKNIFGRQAILKQLTTATRKKKSTTRR